MPPWPYSGGTTISCGRLGVDGATRLGVGRPSPRHVASIRSLIAQRRSADSGSSEWDATSAGMQSGGELPRLIVDRRDVVVLEVDASDASQQRTGGREHDRAGPLARRLLADRRIDDRFARLVDEPHPPGRRLAGRTVQLGADDDTRVNSVAADAVRRPAPVKLDGEQNVRDLRLCIGGTRIVAFGEVGIVQAYAAEPLGP